MSNGTPKNPFDFSAHMQRLCEVIAKTSPRLGHVDCNRIAFVVAQTRKAGEYGMWASLTPLRFRDGALVEQRRGRDYSVQRLFAESGQEMLYILTFYLPRFLELSFDEKLDTIFHELWHIGPEFNGDIRRFGGRCYAHTSSEAEYDRQVDEVVREWKQIAGEVSELDFLRHSFAALKARFGTIVGRRVHQPKLIPL